MKRSKEYFRQASARSRARKKLRERAKESPLMMDAVAICVLVETRGWTFEQAGKFVDAKRRLLDPLTP